MNYELIEYHFNSMSSFGRNCCCSINKNFVGDGISKGYIKVVLPKLPDDVKYEPSLIYNLIKNISLEISGCEIFRYNSEQLKEMDEIFKNPDKIFANNIVYYPINFDLFFRESKLLYPAVDFPDSDYYGLRICNLNNTNISLLCEFGQIYDIVEPNTNKDLENLNFEYALVTLKWCFGLTKNNDRENVYYIEQKFISLVNHDIKESIFVYKDGLGELK